MSTLCLNYYKFLENTLDFNKIITKLNDDCNNIMSWCLQPDFINCSVDDLIDQFPKYLNYSDFFDIKKISSGYNHEQIYNATTMTYDQLRDIVLKDPSLFPIETKIKYTPENIDDQIKEHLFQINYSISIDDCIFNKDFYYNNYSSTEYSDRFANLLKNLPNNLSNFSTTILSRHSFFHLYFINSLINYIVKNRSNLYSILTTDIKTFITPTINKSIDLYFENIVDIVLMNQFSFVNVTDKFKENIYQSSIIQDSVSQLGDLFNDHIETNITSFKIDILETIYDAISQYLSFDFLKKYFNSNSNFNFTKINELFSASSFTSQEVQELMNLYLIEKDTLDVVIRNDFSFKGNILSNFENDLYTFYIQTLNNNYSMQNYYYLLYLYRYNLQRFVNVLDLVSTEYVSNNIYFSGLSHFSTFEHMSNLFRDWSTCIRYPVFNLNITNLITEDKIQNIINSDLNILRMSHTYAYQKQIESFVETDGFKTQVNTIQRNIYNYLRSSGILSNIDSDINTNWCDCTKPLEVYLFFAFKDLIKDPYIGLVDKDDDMVEAYSYFSSYSITSLTISPSGFVPTEEYTIMIDAYLDISVGDIVKITHHTTPYSTDRIDYMIATVVSYNSGLGKMVVNITDTVCSSIDVQTYNSWAISVLPKTYKYVKDKILKFVYTEFEDVVESLGSDIPRDLVVYSGSPTISDDTVTFTSETSSVLNSNYWSIGRQYKINCTVSDYSGTGNIYLPHSGTSPYPKIVFANGTYEYYFTPRSSSMYISSDVGHTSIVTINSIQVVNSLSELNEFDTLLTDFNIKNSYYFFEFYKAFIKSTLTSAFSDALHAKYSLFIPNS